MAVPLVLQVVEDLGVLFWASDAKVIEGFEGDDPRRDGGAEVLAEEGAEGDVFPLLDVAGRPVVEQHHPKDVFLGIVGADRAAQFVTGTDKEAHLSV